jgi:shikimate kinase
MKLSNIFVPFVFCAGLAFAQQPGAPVGQAGAADKDAASMTGCLTRGTNAGEYMLKTDDGQMTVLMSTQDISKHLNHKVKVNGTKDTATTPPAGAAKNDDKDAKHTGTFRVQSVEHISDTCQ